MDGWPPELQEAARFKEIPEASTIGQTHSKEDRRDVYFLEYGEGNGNSLQYSCLKSESEFAQSCPTLSDPVDCGPPGSSVHGIFQARVLESGAIAFSGKLLLP